MFRRLIIVASLIATINSGHATPLNVAPSDNGPKLVALPGFDGTRYVDLHGQLLAITYLCRDAIGTTHYQAARVVTVNDYAIMGGTVQAHDFIARQFAMYNGQVSPKADATVCFEKINNLYFELDGMRSTFPKEQ